MTATEQLSEQYTFFYGAEYWDEVDRRMALAGASSRILLASMPLDASDERVALTMQRAVEAAERGAETSVIIDAHSFLLDHGHLGPLWWHDELPDTVPATFQRKLDMLTAIDNQPTGHTAILNKPERRFSLPFAGRSHIKLGIIDDHVFIVNHNLQDMDVMNLAIGFRNKAVADQLYEIMQTAAREGSVRKALKDTDQTIHIDDTATILLDAGVPGQSIIYEQALELIDAARKWLTITCQYFPNSTTAKHLLEARKHLEPEILFGHPSHQGGVGAWGERLSTLIERMRLPREMFRNRLSKNLPRMHAKLIASELGLMNGSHNYVRAGVKLGTAEIALVIRDEELAKQAVATIHRGIKEQSERLSVQ